jgi:hypothetical protein
MPTEEKLRQVRGATCVSRSETAHTRLEAIAGADNPCCLITIFGRGRRAIKAGGAVYVTRWLGGQGGEPAAPARGSGAETEDIVSLAKGKSTKVQSVKGDDDITRGVYQTM